MSIRSTLINYHQIKEALQDQEAVMTETNNIANADLRNPVEAAALMTGLAMALNKLETAEKHRDVLTSPDHGMASLLQCYIAKRAEEEGKLEPLPNGLMEAKFDDKDWLGWAGSFFKWIKGLKKHKWLKASTVPGKIDKKIRVALLGDWGTGLYGGVASAKCIEDDTDGYGLLIHLGDVYYAGDTDEVKERFLSPWPKNANAISRALNSNHEMYTGGKAYFQLTLKSFEQSASHFALQNDHWTIVGLDSAYRNVQKGGFTKDQIPWLKSIIDQAQARKIILLSHHQPFSIIEQADNDVAGQLGEFLNGGKIFAWYWGHEHRCILYDRHAGWRMSGRCVGHSGYPYFRDKLNHLPYDPNMSEPIWRKLPAKNLNPGGIILDGPNPFVEGHAEDYGSQGHMTLELDGPHLNEIVHLPDGKIIYNRELS